MDALGGVRGRRYGPRLACNERKYTSDPSSNAPLLPRSSALLEYHCNKKDDVSKRIFERGLKKFPDEESFALRYLGFLISINDDTSSVTFSQFFFYLTMY